MPETEFELYLSLLSRFLRLNPAQRAGIADELRDHLEQRLEELASRGLSRVEAIRAALEEFGDAAELAQHFTRAAHVRRRRLMMRVTYGTAAVLAAGLLIAAAFWPESPQVPIPARVIAQVAVTQGTGLMGAAADPIPVATDEEEARNAKVEALLRKPVEVNFLEVELQDAINYLRDASELPLILDHVVFRSHEKSINQTISLQLQNVPTRTVLELVLERADLGYTIRDGLLIVTTAELAHEIKVYNVRDLLPTEEGDNGAPGMMGGGPSSAMGGMMMAMPGMGGRAAGRRGAGAGMAAGMPGTMPAGAAGGPMGAGGGAAVAPVVHQTTSLARVIANTVAPESWGDLGGAGSIIEYNGLLIVKNSHVVHGKVRRLLETMRVSLHQPAAGPGAVGMMGGVGQLGAGSFPGLAPGGAGGGNPGGPAGK